MSFAKLLSSDLSKAELKLGLPLPVDWSTVFLDSEGICSLTDELEGQVLLPALTIDFGAVPVDCYEDNLMVAVTLAPGVLTVALDPAVPVDTVLLTRCYGFLWFHPSLHVFFEEVTPTFQSACLGTDQVTTVLL